MASALILAVIFFVISALLSYLAVKKVFRGITTIFTVLMLALTLFTGWLYFDSLGLRDSFTQEKLFILDEGGELIAAFVHKDSPSPVIVQDLTAEREAYRQGDLKATLGNRELLFITTQQTFNDVQLVHLEDITLSKDLVSHLLRQDDARQAYVDAIREQRQIPPEQQIQPLDVSPEELRSLLFAALVNDYLSTTSTVEALNRREITAYPDRITFWTVRVMPASLLELVVDTGEI